MSIANEKEIVRLYQSGKSIRQICKLLNVSPNPVKKALLANNIEIVKHNKPIKPNKAKEYIKNETSTTSILSLSENIKKKIVKEYLSGKKSIDIAKEYNIKYSTVIKYFSNNSIKKGNKKINLNENDAVSRYNHGETLISLSELYNVSEWSVRQVLNKHNIKTRSTKDLRKNHFDYSFFERESPELYYFMGFMLGDGHITSNEIEHRYCIGIALHSKDLDTIHTFCDWLNFDKNNIYTPPNKDAKYMTINSVLFKDGFPKFGIVPRKTYEPVIPDIMSSKYLNYFLIGLLDADGSVDKKHGYIQLTCNTEIINWYIEAIKHLGFKGKVTVYPTQSKVASRANISIKKDILELAKLLDVKNCNFCMDRKWNIIKTYLKKV